MHRTLLKIDELTRFILQKWYIFLLAFSFSWIILSNVYAVESGTPDDPILIDNCYELQDINNNLDAYYRLTQNIDCSVIPSFVPIAEYKVSKFTGTLDGNHYEIRNLTINQPTKASGLFGEVTGTITDLRLENVNILGTGLNGALASQSGGVIKNVVASGKITYTLTGFSGAGIIAFNSGTIENAQSYLNIEGPAYIGGIVASNSGLIKNSHSYATINHIGTLSDGFAYGGLVGSTNGTSIIENSSSRSTIKGTGTQVGGLVGLNYGKINHSYSYSSITSNGHNVGGAVGTNQGGVIDSSFAEGFLSNSSTSTCTGGFIGSNQSHPLDTADPTIGGTIRNSYSTTTISASGNRVGSFAGCSKNLGGVKTSFENSYATGKVTASGATKGGFLGYVSSTYAVTNSFWDKNTTGLTTSLGGTGKTTLEMNTATTYTGVGWDFANLWRISSGLHNGYPNFIVGPTLPVSPTNLRVISKTDQSIDLAWDSDSNSTNYQLFLDGVLIRQEPTTAFKVENLAANTTYQLKVIAQNVEGDSAPTVINVKTRLSKPTNVLAEKGDGEILVSWDPHSEPSILGYNLYVNDVKVNENPIPKTSKEYLATHLTNYQTYKFTVTAIDSTNEESVSSDSILENPIDLTPPEQVKNVTKTYTDNSVTLSWDNPLTDFYSLLINRGNQLITETSNNVFLDSNLTPSTTYEYELITKDPNGNLSVPYIISVHTKPTAPTGVTAEKGDSKILVSWDPHSDSTILGYNLYVNDIKVNENPLSKTEKEYLVTNLTNYQTYEFTVTAIDSTNEESLSSVPVLDNPIDLTPPQQVKSTKKEYTDHNVILSWVNPTNDFQSILIYRGNQLITETSDSIFLDSNLIPSTTYEYKLITKDPNGNLSDPFSINVHTKPSVPTGVTTVKGDGKILVSWDPYNGFIIGFNVYVDNKRVNNTPLSSTNFSYFISGLKNYQTYKFSVAAVDDTNEESAMSEYIFDNPIDLTLPDKVKDVSYKHTSGSVLLSWNNPVTDFHSVLIYRDNKLINKTSDNIILDSNLNPSTTYEYKLITKDPHGNLSKPFTIRVHTKPTTPKGVSTEKRDSKILVKWNPSNGKSIIGYNVYVDNIRVNTTPITSSSYFVSGLKNYQSYKFSVKAIDATKEESAMSEYIMDNPVDLTPPEKVIGVTYEYTDNSVRLSWENSIADVYSVLIYRGGKLIKETSDNVFVDSKLSPSTKYTYSFVSKDSNGNLSKPYGFTIQTKPKKPKNIQGQGTSNGIDLTWEPNREINIKGYNIYINSKKWNLYPVKKPHQTIPVDAASPGSTFVIQVTAVNKENTESEKSSYKIMIFSPVAEQANPPAPTKAKEELPETNPPNNLSNPSELDEKSTDISIEKEQTVSLEKNETPIYDESNKELLNEQNIRLFVKLIILFLFFFSV